MRQLSLVSLYKQQACRVSVPAGTSILSEHRVLGLRSSRTKGTAVESRSHRKRWRPPALRLAAAYAGIDAERPILSSAVSSRTARNELREQLDYEEN